MTDIQKKPITTPSAVDEASAFFQEETKSRFYERKLPEIDELVMVEVKTMNEIGSFVKLLEYDDLEGFIAHSELSRANRIKGSISRLIKVSQKYVLQVIRVDKTQGYVDLSKRLLTESDLVNGSKKYNDNKNIQGVFKRFAKDFGQDFLALQRDVIWPLYDKYEELFEVLVGITTKEVSDSMEIFEDLPLSNELKEGLIKTIKNKLTAHPAKILAEFELTCYDAEGVEAIKRSLQRGLSLSTKELPVTIQLKSSPTFDLFTTSNKHSTAQKFLSKVLGEIAEEIHKSKGSLKITKEPSIIASESDNKDADN
jgi:translation initiation factor 2 subunit 1